MNNQDDNSGTKKAVHVKWAGKTIALGTFPFAEADEKCARAKALTRAWRSTMRPKPTREWVMNELERLGVRIVSGKLGRKADEEEHPASSMASGGFPPGAGMGAMGQDSPGQQPRSSSLGLGTSSSAIAAGGGTLGGMPPASAGQQVNQHYEMLKLHHMNLLQELHETTMMMNMYQQQQLQQEQLRIQQAQTDANLLNSMSRRGSLGAGFDPFFAGSGSGLSQRGSLSLGLGQRGSLGLGSNMGGLGPRGSLGLGTTGGLKSQLDARLGEGIAGLKRGMDGSGSGDGMKRQKLGGDPSM